MIRLPLLAMVLCAALLSGTALAAEPAPPAGIDAAGFTAWLTEQRADVAQQRTAVNGAYDAQERVCWRRFAVNDCLHAARTERRRQLDALRTRDLHLNDLERERRADQRLRAIADKEKSR